MNNSIFSSVRIALNAIFLCQNVVARKSKIFTTLFFVFSIFMLRAQPWNQLTVTTPITTSSELGIHFVDDQIGYVVGTNGLATKTINGGGTWTTLTTINAGSTSLYSTYFIDALTGFVVGDGSFIKRTDDGGATWQTVTISSTNPPPTGTDYRAVWFYNAYIGFIVGGISGSSGTILRTTNGGLNWDNISPSPNIGTGGKAFYGIFFTDAATGYASDFDSKIWKTTTGNLASPTWTSTLIAPTNNLHGIYFTSKDTGYVAGGNTTTRTGIILKTENAGLTWGIPYNVPADGFLTGLSFHGNTGFAVGGHPTNNTTSVIYKSINTTPNNNFWAPQTTNPAVVSRQYRVSLPDSRTGYSCGINGTILKINGINEKICCDTFVSSFSNANFTYTNTGNVYTFTKPTGTIGSDILTWDFGDGQTGTGSPVTHTYPSVSNSYLATLTITRPQLGGDTCKVKLCQLISTHPCPNLVTNGDFSLGNTGFTTGLNPIPQCNSCVTNAYCVGNSFNSKCSLWPTTYDHTFANASGSFMSIDGNTTGGATDAWRTTITVAPNTTYKFSFWEKAAFTQIPFNIQMDIRGGSNGPILASKLVAVNQIPTWTNHILIWNSGSNTSITLAIKQLSGTEQRDFGIDDITFCCIDCEDFMTEVMNYGIQSTYVSGNTYTYCVSPNVSTSDIVQWDMNCNGTVDATTNTSCQNFTLTSANSQICATVLHVIKPGDTCRVKVNACLPNVSSKPCVCDSTFFTSVDAGFTWVKNSPFSITFTPVNLLNNCDSVKWTFGNAGATASSVGSASVTYTYPSVIGNYQVCMIVTRTDLNGKVCRKEFCLTINLNGLVSLVEITLPNLTFKPNPATNSVIVTMPPSLNSPKNILRLSTIDGRILKTVSVDSTETIMDLEILPAGLYFISLVDNEGKMLTRPSKLVKQ